MMLLCWVVLLTLQHAVKAADLPTQALKPAIVAIGDGLTEGAFARRNDGWGLLMQEKYIRKADVINHGYGGYFTSWMVDYMLDELFNAANPTMAILFLGTKDTLTKPVSGNHYISPEQFAQNVDKIIQAGKAAAVKHFLIISPPPVCETCRKNNPKPWDRENAHSVLYVEQLKALADKHGAGFLNIFESWQKDPDWADKLLLPDKLHLSSAGNQLLFQQILTAIETQVPAMAWANVPLHFPLMDAIDKDNPGAAFDKVVRAPSKKTLRESDNTSSISSRAGNKPAAQEHHQAVSSAQSIAVQGAAWLLLAVVATAWQLYYI